MFTLIPRHRCVQTQSHTFTQVSLISLFTVLLRLPNIPGIKSKLFGLASGLCHMGIPTCFSRPFFSQSSLRNPLGDSLDHASQQGGCEGGWGWA